VGIIKTPYWNLMLDRQILKSKEKHARHRSFLPQEVVRCEVWTSGLQRKHRCKQQSPWKSYQIFTQMSECGICLTCNLWFRVARIKMEQGLL